MNLNPEIVSMLLTAGAKPNLQDDNQMTALMLAAIVGEMNIIRLLLNAGALFNIEDKGEMSALSFAVHRGNSDVVKIMI